MTETYYEGNFRAKKISEREAHFLGKWLMILFWLVVPSTIAGILGNEKIVSDYGLWLTGNIIGIICSLVYGLILMKLSSAEESYKTAGICLLVGAAGTFLGFILGLTMNQAATALLVMIGLVNLVVGLYGTYAEFEAHSEVLKGLDDELSEKWLKLWKWYLWSLIGLISCILLIFISLILGCILCICAVIGIIIVSILKLVYLYQTSAFFTEYRAPIDEYTM